MPDTAAIVVDAKYDVLAWNALAAALLEDFSGLPATDRNLARSATNRGPTSALV